MAEAASAALVGEPPRAGRVAGATGAAVAAPAVEPGRININNRVRVALRGAHAQAGCLLCHNDRGPVQQFAARGCGGSGRARPR